MNSIVLGMYLLINRNIKFYTTDLKLTLHITDTNFDSLHKVVGLLSYTCS